MWIKHHPPISNKETTSSLPYREVGIFLLYKMHGGREVFYLFNCVGLHFYNNNSNKIIIIILRSRPSQTLNWCMTPLLVQDIKDQDLCKFHKI